MVYSPCWPGQPGSCHPTLILMAKKQEKATESPGLYTLCWLAGFLEGDGSFGKHDRNTMVTASQVNIEPLLILKANFGGYIYHPKGRSWLVWKVSGARARGVMMTLYPFMTERRKEQIRQALT